MPYHGAITLMVMLGMGAVASLAFFGSLFVLNEHRSLEQRYGGERGAGGGYDGGWRRHNSDAPYPPVDWTRTPNEQRIRRKSSVKNSKPRTAQICTICLQQIEPDTRLRMLTCNHCFHEKCIKRWAQEKRECPTCRQRF